MFYAKAMYRGGEIIVSADEDLNYYSYVSLGLRCIICGEEVNLRRGSVRNPHFAHFIDVGSSASNCPLRVRGSSDSWSELTVESKGQRRKIFQEYFINIIKKIDNNFDDYIQRVKNIISVNKLKVIFNKCSECFYENNKILITECRSLAFKNYNQNLGLQYLIASEAIEYLSILSSQQLLEQLIYYSIYLCYNESSLSDVNSLISKSAYSKITQTIKEIILETHWLTNLEYFSQKIKVISGDYSKPKLQDNQLLRHILKSIETYFDTSNDALIITYKRFTTFKLRFDDKININLYTMRIVARVGTQEKESYKYFKTIANISNIDIIHNQEIIITWRLIYDKDTSSLYPDYSGLYLFFKQQILQLLKNNLLIKVAYKYNYKKVSFVLDYKDYANLDIDILIINSKSRDKLRKAGINKIKDLIKISREELSKIKKLEPKNVDDIVNSLRKTFDIELPLTNNVNIVIQKDLRENTIFMEFRRFKIFTINGVSPATISINQTRSLSPLLKVYELSPQCTRINSSF